MTHHGETTKRRQITNNHETKTNISANTIPTENPVPAAPQELAERSLHRLPVPWGNLSFLLVGFRLKIQLIRIICFLCEHMRIEHEWNCTHTNKRCVEFTHKPPVPRWEATRLRNMSIRSDLVSLVSYLFICFSSLVVLAKLMLYFQPERKFPDA